MSFLLPCPNCGPRSVYEFRFGGEDESQKSLDPAYMATHGNVAAYDKNNVAGVQTEWWYHRDGCCEWLVAVRNTVTNQVMSAVDGHQ
jgi:sarcosine oxidase subunit delta